MSDSERDAVLKYLRTAGPRLARGLTGEELLEKIADDIGRGVHLGPESWPENQFRHAFHRLWTATVECPGYHKEPWRVLDARVSRTPKAGRADFLAEAKELSVRQGARIE